MFKDKLKSYWYRLSRFSCRMLCLVLFRIQAYGTENIPQEGAFLLVSNHQSYLDPVFCGVALKRQLYYLARESLFRNIFFGALIASVNAIPVKRGQADISAMKEVIAKLKEDKGVCLFPEATRSADGKIQQLKPGFGLLCRRGNAAIVPVVIDGAFECWPRQKKIFRPGKVVISYGKAITAQEVKESDDRALAEKVTGILRQMQNDLRVKYGKNPYNY